MRVNFKIFSLCVNSDMISQKIFIDTQGSRVLPYGFWALLSTQKNLAITMAKHIPLIHHAKRGPPSPNVEGKAKPLRTKLCGGDHIK